MSKLLNKNALIGGGTKGIGFACAKMLSEAGANVTLISRSEENLKSAISKLDVSQGQKHSYIQADYSHPQGLKEKISEKITAGNVYHILINNTGGPPGGPILGAGEDEFRIAFNQHLICNHILVLAVYEGMKTDKYGRIINIISTSVKQPLNNLGVSNTIRGAVANWSKTLSNELGPFGITVNNVLPGATETERLQSIIDTKASKNSQNPELVADSMKSIIPLGRFAQPKETAAAVAFLASPEAGYINGINLPVDGGRTKSL